MEDGDVGGDGDGAAAERTAGAEREGGTGGTSARTGGPEHKGGTEHTAGIGAAPLAALIIVSLAVCACGLARAVRSEARVWDRSGGGDGVAAAEEGAAPCSDVSKAPAEQRPCQAEGRGRRKAKSPTPRALSRRSEPTDEGRHQDEGDAWVEGSGAEDWEEDGCDDPSGGQDATAAAARRVQRMRRGQLRKAKRSRAGQREQYVELGEDERVGDGQEATLYGSKVCARALELDL